MQRSAAFLAVGWLAQLALASMDCSLPVDTVGATCGGSTGFRCDVGNCCSAYGYCGATAEHCSTGCQSSFGTCNMGKPATCAASANMPTKTNNAAAVASTTAATAPKSKFLIGQYWETWTSQSNVDWTYTDIAYYFVTIPTAAGQLDNPQGDMGAFVKAAHQAHKKALLVIGGWTGSAHFSDLAATSSKRNNFIKTIRAAVRNNGFDGVDIDWEYPASAGAGCNAVRSSDTANLLLLLQGLRTALGAKSILSVAVSSTGLIGGDGQPLSDYSAFNKVLNLMTLMIYDVYGPGWSTTSGPNAPLSNSALGYSGKKTVEYYRKGGMAANKLMLGVPAYGYTFQTKSSHLYSTTVAGKSSKLYQATTGKVVKGDCNDVLSVSAATCSSASSTGYAGTWTYNTLISCGALSSDGKTGLRGFTRYWDSTSNTPFLFNSSKKLLIPYEDSQSVQAKTAYAKQQGLAGIAIFASNGFNKQVLQSARAGFQ